MPNDINNIHLLCQSNELTILTTEKNKNQKTTYLRTILIKMYGKSSNFDTKIETFRVFGLCNVPDINLLTLSAFLPVFPLTFNIP